MNISDEAVEAAWATVWNVPGEPTCNLSRREMQAALEAAAPYIIAGYIRETNLKAIAYELETPLLFKKDFT